MRRGPRRRKPCLSECTYLSEDEEGKERVEGGEWVSKRSEHRAENCCEKKAKGNVKCKQATELLASLGKQISDRGIDDHEQVAKIEFPREHDIDPLTGI